VKLLIFAAVIVLSTTLLVGASQHLFMYLAACVS